MTEYITGAVLELCRCRSVLLANACCLVLGCKFQSPQSLRLPRSLDARAPAVVNAEQARSKIAKAPGPKTASKSKGLPQLARISQLVNAVDYQRVAAQLCTICWRPWGRANLLDCVGLRSTNPGEKRGCCRARCRGGPALSSGALL
jgi:hypothetical protein